VSVVASDPRLAGASLLVWWGCPRGSATANHRSIHVVLDARSDAAVPDERRDQRRGVLLVLVAAGLFGASAPLSKRLLPAATPVMLAGLFYGGAGLALTGWGLARRRSRARATARKAGTITDGPGVEAPLRRSDLPTLAAIVLLGGVVGPICLLWGFAHLSGISGALLMNLEAPLTALLAVALFREHLGWRSALAILIIVAAAALLAGGEAPSVDGVPAGAGLGGSAFRRALPPLAVGFACLVWAFDNNLTQRLSVRDPIAVVRLKAWGAAACNLGMAVATGSSWPGWALLIPALVVGAASYGVSVVLDFKALRLLGAAREAAYFATAPFAGALLAIPLLGQRPGLRELVAGLAMAAGVILLIRDRHSHRHTHEVLEHDHLHVHDEHHQHRHEQSPAGIDARAPHAHPHRHDPITHEHPHASDIHHRHRH
jgi:drug/metabolite transporter (DMT)-like permease